jgi:KaiC/GvpD/RAD55 family RecA-like ATPase
VKKKAAKPRAVGAGPWLRPLSQTVGSVLAGGAFANLSRVMPPRFYVPISSVALLVVAVWFVRLVRRSDRYQRRRIELLETILHAQTHPDAEWEYELVWGRDRRAVPPLELRHHRRTGTVEWRYDDMDWKAGKLPGEIASMFEMEEAKKP